MYFAKPFSDGRDAIQNLRERGITIGRVSNCSRGVRDALVEHEMDRWFDHTILSAEVGAMKPATEIYSLAAEALGVASTECLCVGDSSDNELEGAAAAGMNPILYDRTGTGASSGFATVSTHLDLLAFVTPLPRQADQSEEDSSGESLAATSAAASTLVTYATQSISSSPGRLGSAANRPA